jgi:hypothetical protein
VSKLEASRVTGSVTALVLEHWDFILSNPWIAARAVYTAASTLDIPLPDIIIIIDTSAVSGGWLDYLVKFGDWWSDAATDRNAP